eukprot:135743-Prymnesium_polylepis.1
MASMPSSPGATLSSRAPTLRFRSNRTEPSAECLSLPPGPPRPPLATLAKPPSPSWALQPLTLLHLPPPSPPPA